jgi:hypothetical protein
MVFVLSVQVGWEDAMPRRGNEIWAQYFDGTHSSSVTVQVNNEVAFCEIALISTWTAGAAHHESSAFITQIVSANGVENFPTQNVDGGDLVAVAARRGVTSVTFKVGVYKSKGMARWMIHT